MELIETTLGMPNTCFVCGKAVAGETWFARNVDEARSGGGGHKKCLQKHFKLEAPALVEPEPEPEPEPETYPTTKDSE
jgi:hypothetical protein